MTQRGNQRAVVEDADGSCQTLSHSGGKNYATSYTYNGRGLLRTVTQGTLSNRVFEYDGLGRLTSASNPESGTATYAYDPGGNLTSRGLGGWTLALKYDKLQRVRTKTYTAPAGAANPAPVVKYCYDGSITPDGCATAPKGSTALLAGRLTMVDNAEVQVRYESYDALGRVLEHSVKPAAAASPYVFGYGYNELAQTSETYPSGRVVTWSYDGAGRPSGVQGTKNEVTSTYAGEAHYAAHGALDRVQLKNQLWETSCFNTRQQMTRLAVGTTSTLATACAAAIAATDFAKLRLDYGYAAGSNNGNVTSQTIWVDQGQREQQTYTYDVLNRLKTVVAGTAWRQTYVYDRYGNRAQLAGTVNGNLVLQDGLTPQVTTDSESAVAVLYSGNRLAAATVDAAGNVEQLKGTAYPHLKYDGEGRVLSAETGVGSTSSAGYDGEGRRVRRTVGTQTTYYVHDAQGRLVAEYGAVNDTSGTSTVTVDALGSTRLVTNDDKTVARRYDYLPFGQEIPAGLSGRTEAMGYLAESATDWMRVKFTGKERDAETTLDYFGARYLSGAQGRFTSPDTAGPRFEDPQSFNKYAYTRNNPLRRIDPDGRYDRDVHMNLTFALGVAAGFSDATALGFAAADQGVDDDPQTVARAGFTEADRQINGNWHFPSDGRMSELAAETATNLSEASLGRYLHVYQDSFSHAGYGLVAGHAADGYKPDETWRRPELANKMAEGTYSNLSSARTTLRAPDSALPWQQVAPYVDRFNRAKTKKDKDRALADLRKAVSESRKRQEEERERQRLEAKQEGR